MATGSTMSMTSSYSFSASARPARPKLARLDTSEHNLLVGNEAASGSRPGTPPALDGPKRGSPRGTVSSASPRPTLLNSKENEGGTESKWYAHTQTSPSSSPVHASPQWSPTTVHEQDDVVSSSIRLSPANSTGANLFAPSNHDGKNEAARQPRRRFTPPLRVTSSSSSAIPASFRMASQTERTAPETSKIPTTPAFEVSEIMTNFLYLGPEITSMREAEYLRDQLGIRRILNAAWEIEEGGGEHLRLHDRAKSGFERYRKLPLKDTVEAKGVQKSIEEACAFLDDARLHSAPTYVHCKAGKSRSVMLVMAFLIHCNGWTLARAYDYVAERRREVSPNIGFVAELMAFADKQSSNPRRRLNDGEAAGKRGGRSCQSTSGLDVQQLTHFESDTRSSPPQGSFSAPASVASRSQSLSGTAPGEYTPMEDPREAPKRRSMLAALDTDSLFLRTNAIRLLDSASCETSPFTQEVASSNSNSTGTFSSGSAMSS